MGTTFVSVDGKLGFWMRDSMLELFLRFAALHLEDSPEPDRRPNAIRDQWLLASRGWFSGCVPHELGQAVSTPEGRKLVEDATRSLLKALSSAPEVLPPEVLNLMGFDGTWQFPLETWRLMETAQAILDLMAGSVGAPADDASFMPGCGERPWSHGTRST